MTFSWGALAHVTLYDVMLCVMFHSVFYEVSQVLCGQCQCRAADVGPLQKSGTHWKTLYSGSDWLILCREGHVSWIIEKADIHEGKQKV